MWRIFHALFGWHYVLYKDSATEFITRVKTAPNGRLYIRHWTGVYHYHLAGNGKFSDDRYGSQYIPLTFLEEWQQ